MNTEDRYARHYLIEGWDQERLRNANVLVAGAGAIGNEVIKLLALLGIGHLLIVDFDTVEISNLARCVLFREEDIGRFKANVSAERARQIHPEMNVSAIQGDLEFDVGLDVYRAMDLVIGCLDSLQARLALNRACRKMGVPWLNGAIEVSTAEVSLFGYDTGPCFECAMSPEMWERRSRRYSCTGLRSSAEEAPMPTTAIMASLVAGYLVQEALYLLHSDLTAEKEGLRFGQKLTIQTKPYELAVYNLPVNPDCLAHEVWHPIELVDHFLDTTTARALLYQAGQPEGVVELGFDLLTEMRCISCGRREAIFRPLDRCSDNLTYCSSCGCESRHPEMVNWLDAESEGADIPLPDIGFPPHSVICVKSEQGRRYFQLGGEFQFDPN